MLQYRQNQTLNTIPILKTKNTENMQFIKHFVTFCLIFHLTSCNLKTKKNTTGESSILRPNIVIIYADDLGYGDVSSYGATELRTPNIDRISNEGIKFNNGYATSPTCTPSRFSLLSGTYPFRSRKAKVLSGNAPLLLEVGKQTLPSMLQDAGYFTGVVGKWHLGLGDENLNWNEEIKPGPREVGFDYSFIMAATNDRVPSVYIKNNQVYDLDSNDPLEVSYHENFEGEPTGKDNPELLKVHPSHGHDHSIHNGISRIGYMRGGKSALFIDEDMSDDFLKESKKFINDHKDKPFFLLYSLHQPHVPRVPHPRFAGKSGLGARGDVILEADWAVGQFLDELDKLGLAKNTIVIFSSDNGPVLDDGYKDEAITKNGKHTPSGGLRGGKYSKFDAGTHVPFMVRWPAKIKPGFSDALVCQIDFTASFASLVGQENLTPDSENMLDAFIGKSKVGRDNLILGNDGLITYIKGDYVLIPPQIGPKVNWVNHETGNDLNVQLFNIKEDRGQLYNIADQHPELVSKMLNEIENIKNR